MTAKRKAKAEMRLEAHGHGEKGAQPRMEDAHGFERETGCFVVADGLGQRQGGQYAAVEAVQQVLDVARDRRHLDAQDALRHAMHMASLAVLREQSARDLPCQASLAALLLRGDRALIAWCGDVRVYRLRLEGVEGRVRQWRPSLLVRDHRDAGGMLLRNLGGPHGRDSDTAEYHETDARPGDVFALVTHGVWGALGSQGVGQVLMDAHVGEVTTLTARWVAEELTCRPLERGGTDNATALVVRVGHV
jgi:protein phosphatase